jgi:hypothetical protein
LESLALSTSNTASPGGEPSVDVSRCRIARRAGVSGCVESVPAEGEVRR